MGRILLLLAVLAAAPVLARATPLDADACTKLLEEHGQLEQAGVEADMAKGPEWAKTNLVPEKLARIRRFIEIEGQLLFRCRQKSLVNLPHEVENGQAGDGKDQDKNAVSPRVPPAGAADKTGTKAPPAAKKKGTQPAKKAAPPPAAKPASKQTKQASDGARPPAKAKPAAKQPAGAKAAPAPPAAATKGAPKDEK